MKTYKWTEQQKKALRGSIRKWVKIVNGTGEDEGADNCPCCKIWAKKFSCKGCPIEQLTGEGDCRGTPYRYTLVCPTGEQKNANQVELNFLRAVYLEGGSK